MVNVALLSFAHTHAKGYARELKENPRAKIVVVWDQEEYGGKQAAAELGVPFESDLSAVLSRRDVDGVVINAPSVLHRDLIVHAARSRKHIFTEKVMAMTVAECDEVIHAVRRAKVKFVVSLPFRGRGEVQLALRVAREGWLGKIGTARLRLAHKAALDGWFQDKGGTAWFHDERRAGGGALFDLGCHMVDLVRALMGTPRQITARMTNLTGRYPIDDNSVLLVEFEGGGLGTVEVSWVHGSGPGQAIELYGTEGHFVWRQDQKPELVSKKLGAEASARIAADLPPARPKPTAQWINLVEDGTPTELTLEVGRDLTELMQAAYQSWRTGKTVALPLAAKAARAPRKRKQGAGAR